MLNPNRTAAGGKPLFSLCVMPWADDASGNQSKQYNPHINLCTQNLSIPHEKLKHQYFVRFCSTSQHASSGEQFRPFIEAWCSTFLCWCLSNAESIFSGHNRYLKAYDCKLNQDILFRVFPHCLPADNPQQAENSSGVGAGGNYNCICGKGGGSKEERESDDGYHALFSVSFYCITHTAIIKISCLISLTMSSEQLRKPSTLLQTNSGLHAEV